jgi:hypothetical protein
MNYYSWFVFEFWRFQFVQKEVAKLAQTAIEYPPMQPGASFNLEAVEAQIQKAQEAAVTVLSDQFSSERVHCERTISRTRILRVIERCRWATRW